MRRADHSSRGVLPTVLCLSVILNSRQYEGRGPLGAVAPWCAGVVCTFVCLLAEIRPQTTQRVA